MKQKTRKSTRKFKHDDSKAGKIYLVIGLALVLFLLYNSFQITSLKDSYEKRLVELKEEARPGEVQLVVITTPNCTDCYNIQSVVDIIKSTGVNVTSEKEAAFGSAQATTLINKYDIKELPSVIVTGEINKSRALVSRFRNIGEEINGAYVFTKLEAPFVDATTGAQRGSVSLIYLKKQDCAECSSLEPFITQLSKAGIKLKEQREVDSDSQEGKNLINKYNIKKIPSIILDEELSVYPTIVSSWSKLGSVEPDGSYVLRQVNPPYYSLDKNKVVGLVSMTVLVDSSCLDCYDADKFNKPILQRMGLFLAGEDKIDISSEQGKALLEKYNIDKVPMIILTGDVEEYPIVVNAWKDVGTKESDGAYVFRKVEIAQKTYKDLTTGEIIAK